MRVRLTAAAGVVALLALATASATGAKIAAPQAPASEITVWLMSDAQSNWPEAVAAANQAFKQQHPGVDVNVQYQGWGDYKTKFEATLAAGQRARRDRVRQHRHAQVLGGGRARAAEQGGLPQLGDLALRPRQGGHLQRAHVRRPVLRRRPRRHLPDRPVQGGGDHSRRRSRWPSSWPPAAS